MPNISNKGMNMPESPIRKLVPFAESAKKNNIEVLHLNIGQPDIKPPNEVLKKIKNFDISTIEYTHSAGIESYRKGIANYYNNIGINVSYEDIIVTTGGSEALIFSLNSILDPGDEIIIPEPFYANYNGFAILSSVKVNPIISKIENRFKLPSSKEFEKLINPKTKAILICNPNNPTGYLYSQEEIHELAKIVKKHDIFLIVDEVYREFIYDENNHYSVLNELEIIENVIVIDSISKRYSMCGARIGCITSRNKNLIQTCLKFAQARLSPPTFGQLAAMEALKTKDIYFNNVIGEYEKRRDLLVSELNKIDGVYCPKPSGAFYCIAELPIDNADKFCQWILENYSINNKTIMMAPASGFYTKENMGKKQVRIAYVLNTEKIKLAISILKGGIKEYKRIQLKGSGIN